MVMPHKPLAPSEQFYKTSGAGLYGDVIAEIDSSVGQVLDKIKELGLDEQTLVIFTSDNGPWYGGSSGGLRGMKGTMFEGGIRVPLIARWPGKIPAGHVSGEPAGTIDVLPTLLAAAGVDVPKDRVIDGRDIMPLLTSDAKSPHDALFAAQGDKLATVRSGPWKLHVPEPKNTFFRKGVTEWIDPRAPDGVTILAPYEQCTPRDVPGVYTGDEPKRMMLFNLDDDPAEQHDVAAQHPDVVKRLKKLFDEVDRQFVTRKKK
jgi:uncharacterized sulfatase